MSTNLNLGSVITTEQHRDAIHIAVAPVIANENLKRGEHVGLVPGTMQADSEQKHIGIVDPYLSTTVKKGQKFWLFLYPQTVTSLRHEWEHPAFVLSTPVIDKSDSVQWLKAYALRTSPYYQDDETAYEQLIEHAKRGEIYYYGSDLHCESDLDEPQLLFYHLSIVLGRPVTPDGFTFSCSC